jgi:tetratricopeptide (TPR) repeat protein
MRKVTFLMKMPAVHTMSLPFLILVFFVFFAPVCFAQKTSYLQEGIRQYHADNYEEAVELLKKARSEAPGSTEAAFLLGMTYKLQSDYPNALPHLMDAITLTPPIREALVELIDVLYRLDRTEEANKWLAVAERDGIFPAKTAFLRGMALAKQGKYTEAIAAFERSKSLDKTYTQAADFQIGLAYMMERRYKQSAERFRAAVVQDPVSDLGTYARRYQELVEERGWIERPVRLTINLTGQYDTNMIQEPYSYPGLTDAGEEKSLGMLSTVRLDYVPILKGPWLFNAGYALSSSLHEKNSTTHDFLVNHFSVAPGYSFGSVALNLSASYTHALKRDPSYTNYSEQISAGPLARVMLTEKKDQILEFYAGYLKKHYFKTPLLQDEDQSAEGLESHVSWMKIYESGAILIVRYGYTTENADGSNWSNQGHRLSINGIIPLREKLRMQLGADIHRQDYKNESTIPAFNKTTRRDTIYTGTAGIIWDINRNVSLLLQYTGIRTDSNIFLYDCGRQVYSVGAEFRF